MLRTTLRHKLIRITGDNDMLLRDENLLTLTRKDTKILQVNLKQEDEVSEYKSQEANKL